MKNIIEYLEKIWHPFQHAEEISWQLCRELQVKVSRKFLCEELGMHPHYPSLLAISDVFTRLGVHNLSFCLKKGWEKELKKIDGPFLVQVYGTTDEAKLFAVVRSIRNNSVDWYNPEAHRWETVSWEYFQKRYTGYTQVYEVDPKAEEKRFEAIGKTEKFTRFWGDCKLNCVSKEKG